MAFDCMNDCLHLKACRRVQAIGRKHRLNVPRYCTEECTAYVSQERLFSEVAEAIEWAFEQGRNGNDYIRCDLNGLISLVKEGEQ